MKLQISFDFSSISEAISVAKTTAEFADILEVGTLLLYKEGVKAVEEFRKEFPDKIIFVDSKICDRAKESTLLFSKAGANIISVLAGTSNKTIFEAAQAAHSNNSKVALDLVDSYSMGESCLEAKKLGIDIILFHRSHEETQIVSLIDQWDTVRGNTDLPIFASGKINRSNIDKVLFLKPQGIIVGAGITRAENPQTEAEYFRSLINGRI
jgi:3-hexulose-6-phosphate synthase/6-phospho-3-hexuloisomerase